MSLNTADVLVNQMAANADRCAADNQQPTYIAEDNSQSISNILDMDLQQISFTDSDIIRFMENTEPAPAVDTAMEENMSDSLSRLRIQRSP